MQPDHLTDGAQGAIWGAFIADAIAMPVHWYYDVTALDRDYGEVQDFLAPKNPHPDSILWRSQHIPRGPAADILHEQAQYWGRRGIHYHQFLRAGENTLNLQLGLLLIESLQRVGDYDSEDYLQNYIHFMQSPESHRDTYIEEYHRYFFNNLASGAKSKKCGVTDIHIGGLAHVPILAAWFASDLNRAREAVREHVQLTHRSRDVLDAADTTVQILHNVFNNGNLRQAIVFHGNNWVSERKMERWRKEPDRTVVGRRLSPACYIDDAFPAALYLCWKYAEDFASGVKANANVGGDSCHRGVVVGGLLGAARGLTHLPVQWKNKLVFAQRLQESTQDLMLQKH